MCLRQDTKCCTSDATFPAWEQVIPEGAIFPDHGALLEG
jgi:hypothetical protein